MSALDQINAYMARLEARLRWLLWSRGLAVAAGAALAITVLLAVFLRLAGFIDSALTSGRTLLFLAVALAVAFGLAVPLLRLNRRWAARRAESQYPGFQQRLLTLVERQGQPGPLAELLAEDALAGARENEPEKLVPAGWIIGLSTAAGAAATALLWLVFAGPGFLGYGSALLWGNTPRTDLYPARTILVQPGNLTLRRKAGLQVTARLIGFSAPAVRLFARYRNTPKWDAIPMQAEPGGDRYQFLIAGVDDTLGEPGVLGEEPVPGMHRLRVAALGRLEHRVDVQVALRGLRRADEDRLVGLGDEGEIGVGLRVHRDGLDAHGAHGPDHPAGDLSAVRDQHRLEHRSSFFARLTRE